MTLGAQVSGLPGYDLSITDSSLFVYSNIDIDTGNIGSVSSANVYLASAVINSAPARPTASGLHTRWATSSAGTSSDSALMA